MTSILILGATGYIGGALVARLKQEIPTAQLTALVRNPAHAGVLRDLGLSVVLGDVEDLGRVVSLASSTDIVINAAVSGHIPLIQAILAGQRCHPDNRRKTALIHLSRSALSIHQEEPCSLGLQTTTTNDLNTDRWMQTQSSDMSRLVDNELSEVVDDPLLSIYIVAPATVFGEANTLFPRRTSHQLRGLIQFALESKRMVLPSDSMNVRNCVHLPDLIDLILRITRFEISRPIDGRVERTMFFFASGPEFYWGQVAMIAAKMMYQKGLLSTCEVSTCRPRDYPQLREYATNARVESLRGKALGWSPNTELSILDGLEKEIDGILQDLREESSSPA